MLLDALDCDELTGGDGTLSLRPGTCYRSNPMTLHNASTDCFSNGSLGIGSPLSDQAERQVDSYVDTFETRGDSYNAASAINESARNTERDLLIQLMDVDKQHVVCDAPAGGGYLADGLRGLLDRSEQLVCVEPSKTFAKPLSPDYTIFNSSISEMPVGEETFDRIGSLAGLHHVYDKLRFFKEAARTLKPGGLVVIGDVRTRTSVAKFLNGPVDRFTLSGHTGMFLRPDEYSRGFEKAGLEPVLEQVHHFNWRFHSIDQMVDYCKSLFGMVKATRSQVKTELHKHFEIESDAGQVMMPWSLVYGVGRKKSATAF